MPYPSTTISDERFLMSDFWKLEELEELEELKELEPNVKVSAFNS